MWTVVQEWILGEEAWDPPCQLLQNEATLPNVNQQGYWSLFPYSSTNKSPFLYQHPLPPGWVLSPPCSRLRLPLASFSLGPRAFAGLLQLWFKLFFLLSDEVSSCEFCSCTGACALETDIPAFTGMPFRQKFIQCMDPQVWTGNRGTECRTVSSKRHGKCPHVSLQDMGYTDGRRSN